jgi:LysR family hydrogen peroxide-inducible transcriptional activator
MQIKELEEELGIQLVERRSGEVELTDVGSEVVRRAEQVLASTRPVSPLTAF